MVAPASFGSSSSNILPNYLRSPPLNAEAFSSLSQNPASMYNNLTLSLAPDFSIPSAELDSLNQHHKVNGFSSGPFQSSSYSSYPQPRQRHPNSTYRDSATYSAQPFSHPQSEIYVPSSVTLMSSQSQTPSSTHGFDAMHHPGRQYDYALSSAQPTSGLAANGQPKQTSFGRMDAFRVGIDSNLSQPHIGKPGSMSNGGSGLLRDGQMPTLSSQPGAQQNSHLNGLTHSHNIHGSIQSQSPFGSQLPVSASGPLSSSLSQGGGVTGAPGMNMSNNPQNAQQQEEISTIFVVGFPDDMSEREFQNMFTFSAGFEAATLKIPNKELSAYGTPGLPSAPNSRLPGMAPYAGMNDPYNVVNLNQGGIVVDGGRDGVTASWPAAMASLPPQADDSHYLNAASAQQLQQQQPPRKQIIGFAKFRTRHEALEARDVLQGRRVDFEKGSVLKAEMAKKNLHTKRGPGVGGVGSVVPLGLSSLINNAGAVGAAESLAAAAGLNGIAANGLTASGEVFSQRDKALGPMGIAGLGQRRERIDAEDEERKRAEMGLGNSMSLAYGPRGARERAEEDERERERKRKEKEALRLRQNSYAFEAFHSVPQQMVREGANSLLSAENGSFDPNLYAFPPALANSTSTDAPWSNLTDSTSVKRLSQVQNAGAPESPSSMMQSPPAREAAASPPSTDPTSSSSQNGSTLPTSVSAPFSPQSNSSSLSGQGEQVAPRKDSASSSSSVSGSQPDNDEELSRAVNALAVSTSQTQSQGSGTGGTMSPQLPSPASGGSAGCAGRNPGDQNPPINTLYVGNLPTATSGTASPNYLEERLKLLFQKQPGFKKLCFRQKSNGPMCFVEFEDVVYASQAMKELYGNTLDGLVKNGGIRLSYSKNPLGVRTPTGATNGSSLQHQQQQQNLNASHFFSGDVYPQRLTDLDSIVRSSQTRRETSSGLTSPTSASNSSYHYTTSVSSQPPRFISSASASSLSSPLSTSPFAASSSALAFNSTYPRGNQPATGFGFSASNTTSSSTFSPFSIGISSTPASHSSIPDQSSTEPVNKTTVNDRISHVLSPATAN
ncbi:hypothetical protein C8Q75DRAFT_372084 [Abortiporus biennis]|nr:hypothetical protein C8Q75DRAFT_372084 [Abortiporus biennis]